MNNKISEWERKNKILLEEMDKWRDGYICKENCWEWEKWKFCKHLRKDRARVFSDEIGEQIRNIDDLLGQLYNLNKEQIEFIYSYDECIWNNKETFQETSGEE